MTGSVPPGHSIRGALAGAAGAGGRALPWGALSAGGHCGKTRVRAHRTAGAGAHAAPGSHACPAHQAEPASGEGWPGGGHAGYSFRALAGADRELVYNITSAIPPLLRASSKQTAHCSRLASAPRDFSGDAGNVVFAISITEVPSRSQSLKAMHAKDKAEQAEKKAGGGAQEAEMVTPRSGAVTKPHRKLML